MYKVEIDAVIRGDAGVDERYGLLVNAFREALINAAKHSGRLDVDVYAELSESRAEVFVRDRGAGFELEATTGRGMTHSMSQPVEAVGGVVEIKSAPNAGTEVMITMDGTT